MLMYSMLRCLASSAKAALQATELDDPTGSMVRITQAENYHSDLFIMLI